MIYFKKTIAVILIICTLLLSGLSVNAASLKEAASPSEEKVETSKERKVIKKKSMKGEETKSTVKQENTEGKKSEARLALEQKQKAGTMKMKDFIDYINKEYGSINTSIGELTFTTDVIDHRSNPYSYHYRFITDYNGVDLEKLYHHAYTKEQEKELLKVLEEEQLSIYKDAVHFFPQYKFGGGYWKTRTWEERQNDLYDVHAFTWYSHWEETFTGEVHSAWATSADTFDFKPNDFLEPLI